MRDRLIDLIKRGVYSTCVSWEELADYLLESGIIVPPCKLHDEVWFIAKKQGDEEFRVFYGHADCIDLRNGWRHVIIARTDYQDSYRHVTVFEDFGKTVFLSEEEANKALEEFKNGA
jgi:hypothetical protein